MLACKPHSVDSGASNHMVASKESFTTINLLGGPSVDVIVTSECIHLYFLCIVPQCLFQDVSVMYLSHVMLRCSYQEVL